MTDYYRPVHGKKKKWPHFDHRYISMKEEQHVSSYFHTHALHIALFYFQIGVTKKAHYQWGFTPLKTIPMSQK